MKALTILNPPAPKSSDESRTLFRQVNHTSHHLANFLTVAVPLSTLIAAVSVGAHGCSHLLGSQTVAQNIGNGVSTVAKYVAEGGFIASLIAFAINTRLETVKNKLFPDRIEDEEFLPIEPSGSRS